MLHTPPEGHNSCEETSYFPLDLAVRYYKYRCLVFPQWENNYKVSKAAMLAGCSLWLTCISISNWTGFYQWDYIKKNSKTQNTNPNLQKEKVFMVWDWEHFLVSLCLFTCFTWQGAAIYSHIDGECSTWHHHCALGVQTEVVTEQRGGCRSYNCLLSLLHSCPESGNADIQDGQFLRLLQGTLKANMKAALWSHLCFSPAK